MCNLKSNTLLYPEAIAQISKDLQLACKKWEYLSSISGDGPINEFENKIKNFIGGKHAIALTNCTSALYVALLASGIGQGDEVILPAYTWPQTLSPVIFAGATPVFADIRKNSFSINPENVEKLISKKTKAIIGVHLYGIPAEIDELIEIKRKYNCKLIFDAAQAFGALYKNNPLGEFGDFVALSFGKSKMFSIGEGGMLICNNRKLYENAILLSQHPLRAHKEIDDYVNRSYIEGVSLNYRMHPLIASLGIGQLRGFESNSEIKNRRKKYKDVLKKIKALDLQRVIPLIPINSEPCGISIPLIIKKYKILLKTRKLIRNENRKIKKECSFIPLNMTNMVKNRILTENLKIKFCSFHWTHKIGSCPNAEALLNRNVYSISLN